MTAGEPFQCQSKSKYHTFEPSNSTSSYLLYKYRAHIYIYKCTNKYLEILEGYTQIVDQDVLYK